MNKKPLARMMHRPAAQTEPQWPLPGQINGLPVYVHGHKAKFIEPPKSLHPNVGTIGRGLDDELRQALQATPIYPKNFYDLPATTAPPIPTDFDYEEITRLANKMRELRQIATCGVPDNLRETFKASGFTDDELDRMVIYPERCAIRGDSVEIVYKLRDEHGELPKEPSIPQWRHVAGLTLRHPGIVRGVP